MRLNYFKLLLLLLFKSSINGQILQINKVVVDFQTKQPLEYVNISNDIDNTISNKEGLFVFVSRDKHINISSVGYETINTTFEEINKQDTIFLKSNIIELEEIIVDNVSLVLNEVYRNGYKNYFLEPYLEEFFLRGILKRDNTIIRFQDVFGKVERNSLFVTQKNPQEKYLVEISSLRKIGISEKENNEYIEFPSFKTLFRWYSAVFNLPNEYVFTIEKINDLDYLKINFSKSEENKNTLTRKGYYVINKKDKSIKEVNYSMVGDVDKIEFNGSRGLKWRTIGIDLYIHFKKNEIENKYYIGNATLKNTFETIKGDKKTIYEAFYDLITIRNDVKEKLSSNFSVDKDIFKAKFPYSEQFWNTQNQLPLTNELHEFIKRVLDNRNNKEFEIMGNFK
ncbi:hypothetical protein HYN56_09015 [Flavobacterium crocinum]|uniref:Carboxypeptidase-like regulatory domain-containing protein n=1 Tax=Flavobacterium crocinum TaxID=2183896 RepID=A0A2S1YJW2_9FLAO|nr:hypothetical protein [Flavobacterium crocinum]AWK04369.1 hypothetical protein HYN56_09015 [Flavobacterium crocinum]